MSMHCSCGKGTYACTGATGCPYNKNEKAAVKLTRELFISGSKFSPIDTDGIVFQFVGNQGLPKGNKGYVMQWGPFINERKPIAEVTDIRNSGFTAGLLVIMEFITKDFEYSEFTLTN